MFMFFAAAFWKNKYSRKIEKFRQTHARRGIISRKWMELTKLKQTKRNTKKKKKDIRVLLSIISGSLGSHLSKSVFSFFLAPSFVCSVWFGYVIRVYRRWLYLLFAPKVQNTIALALNSWHDGAWREAMVSKKKMGKTETNLTKHKSIL